MTPIARIPRTRGAFSGLLLVLLGAWGGLIPFIGPYFHYAYTPDKAWVYSTGRLWLEILPGAAAALGGLMVMSSARRHTAAFGAFLAALAGAWFVVGNLVSTLWNSGTPQAGVPAGTGLTRLAAENLGFFTGLGAVIIFFAALALGRFMVVGVRETAIVERATADEAAAAEHDAAAEREAVAEREAAAERSRAAERGTEPVSRTRTDLPPVTDDDGNGLRGRGNLLVRRRSGSKYPETEGLTDRKVQDGPLPGDEPATTTGGRFSRRNPFRSSTTTEAEQDS
jgi:hypothetical protein